MNVLEPRVPGRHNHNGRPPPEVPQGSDSSFGAKAVFKANVQPERSGPETSRPATLLGMRILVIDDLRNLESRRWRGGVCADGVGGTRPDRGGPLGRGVLGSGLFPVLEGDLELAPLGEHLTQLAISARYTPPLDGFGLLADRAILHRWPSPL